MRISAPHSRAAILDRLQRDPIMATLVVRYGEPLIDPVVDSDHLFARLVGAIVSQQISVKAAAAITRRLQSAGPGATISPESVIEANLDGLRSCGLSMQKARYLTDLAQHVLTGKLVLEELVELDDKAIMERLTMVKGIGCWTAQMFLIFALQRPDVLPVNDLGLRTALQRQYGLASLPTADEVENIAAGWSPYRTYGALYLWRSLNNLPSDSDVPL